MARTTLKLPKPIDRTTAAKPSTARGKHAQDRKRRAPPPPAPAKPASRPAPPPSERHENPEEPRLSKRMSELGLCSRREADEWIENGWVRVDGKVVTTLGIRVPRDANIEVDPAAK